MQDKNVNNELDNTCMHDEQANQNCKSSNINKNSFLFNTDIYIYVTIQVEYSE